MLQLLVLIFSTLLYSQDFDLVYIPVPVSDMPFKYPWLRNVSACLELHTNPPCFSKLLEGFQGHGRRWQEEAVVGWWPGSPIGSGTAVLVMAVEVAAPHAFLSLHGFNFLDVIINGIASLTSFWIVCSWCTEIQLFCFVLFCPL